jgi:hypothetical protein
MRTAGRIRVRSPPGLAPSLVAQCPIPPVLISHFSREADRRLSLKQTSGCRRLTYNR